MTLLEAAAFQWVNPKAWVLAVTAMALYADPANAVWTVLVIGAVFAVAQPAHHIGWAAFGVALRGFLSDPVRLKWFNITMGLLLAATLWPMVRQVQRICSRTALSVASSASAKRCR